MKSTPHCATYWLEIYVESIEWDNWNQTNNCFEKWWQWISHAAVWDSNGVVQSGLVAKYYHENFVFLIQIFTCLLKILLSDQ